MVDLPGAIPSANEPFIQPDGSRITRTWFRVLAALTKQSGQLAQPIIVKANSFFTSGSLNSGGTLDPVAIPTGSLLGNSAGSDAAASPQAVDSSLSLDNGVLGVAPLAAFSLLGNSGSVAAQPSGITIGAGLTLVPTTPPQLEATGGGGSGGTPDLTGAQVLSWWRG